MSMTITLYRTDYSPNTAVKDDIFDEGTGHPTLSLSGTLKEKTSVIDPVIIVDSSSTSSVLTNYNYAKIPAFNNRYYFITDIVSISNKLTEIHMHVDVLYTYWNNYKTEDVFIERNANNYNAYLIDNEIVRNINYNTAIVNPSTSTSFSRSITTTQVNVALTVSRGTTT